LPRRQSNCCAKHQRWVSQAVKRARVMALLPYVADQ
jgi:small subunit ribosomal protein S18